MARLKTLRGRTARADVATLFIQYAQTSLEYLLRVIMDGGMDDHFGAERNPSARLYTSPTRTLKHPGLQLGLIMGLSFLN